MNYKSLMMQRNPTTAVINKNSNKMDVLPVSEKAATSTVKANMSELLQFP